MAAISRRQWGWALYDWGNSAFATTVMAGFFPVFFKSYWASELAVTESTFWLGMGNGIASLLVVLTAPVLGALLDRQAGRKRLLMLFTFLGVLMSFSLSLIGGGEWWLALLVYGLGILGFALGLVPYDSLLLAVAGERELDRISALGFALGYLGGGLLFAFDIYLVTHFAQFGFADAAGAVRAAFVSVAVWWALFSLPLWLFVPEPEGRRDGGPGVLQAFRDLRDNFRELRRYRDAYLFLLAYWLYIDGVDTIVRMAVDYGMALGFQANDLMLALLITQFVGFPAAILFGHLGERLGPKQGIGIALLVYILVVFWSWRMDAVWEFYALAVSIGLVQGGIQSLSRSLFARLIPPERSGTFFGLYNMMGKFAAVLGPMLVGWVAVASGSPRTGILSVLLLFLGGALLLRLVTVEPGKGNPGAESKI